jgi:uncharacterized protein YndB with AHSA1/START domain
MNPQKILIQTTVKASIPKIWQLFTEAQHIEKWYFATDSWQTTNANNDLKVGGSFKWRMEAKDGSMGFDFEGTYLEIEPLKNIVYELGDGRRVKITFKEEGDHVRIEQAFDAEHTYSIAQQEAGWKAILINFKHYAEKRGEIVRLHFECQIAATPDQVEHNMLSDAGYRKWTTAFNPGSYFKGNWRKGNTILFLGVDEKGKEIGMLSWVREYIPGKFICIEHIGSYHDGKEIFEGDEVETWLGCLEIYRFEENKKGTLLKIETDSTLEFENFFRKAWPNALAILKSLCE